MQLPVAWVPVDKQDQVFRSLIHKLNIKNDHTSRLNRKLNSLAVISMHPERVNELELNNRPIKVFIELTECGNVDTEVQTYQLLRATQSQARLLFLSTSTALLSWTISHQALSFSNASLTA